MTNNLNYTITARDKIKSQTNFNCILNARVLWEGLNISNVVISNGKIIDLNKYIDIKLIHPLLLSTLIFILEIVTLFKSIKSALIIMSVCQFVYYFGNNFFDLFTIQRNSKNETYFDECTNKGLYDIYYVEKNADYKECAVKLHEKATLTIYYPKNENNMVIVYILFAINLLGITQKNFKRKFIELTVNDE